MNDLTVSFSRIQAILSMERSVRFVTLSNDECEKRASRFSGCRHFRAPSDLRCGTDRSREFASGVPIGLARSLESARAPAQAAPDRGEIHQACWGEAARPRAFAAHRPVAGPSAV